MTKIEGVYPALLTAFDESGKLDFNAYRRFIGHLYDKGVHGVYVGGVCGEGLLLSLEEREAAAKIAIDASRSRGRAIIHVGCATTTDAVRLARHAAKNGAAAVGCLAPYAGQFGIDSLILHFRAVADAAQPLPALLYYFPKMAPSLATYDMVERLLEIPNVIGMKFTASDTSEFATAMFECGQTRTLLSGIDDMFAAALMMGASGAIGSFVNVVPDWFVDIYELAREQRWEEARQVQSRLVRLIRIVEQYPFISALKHLAASQGFSCGEARLPHQPLSRAQKTELREALAPLLPSLKELCKPLTPRA
jgi:N-acetylneuraminate lyase